MPNLFISDIGYTARNYELHHFCTGGVNLLHLIGIQNHQLSVEAIGKRQIHGNLFATQPKLLQIVVGNEAHTLKHRIMVHRNQYGLRKALLLPYKCLNQILYRGVNDFEQRGTLHQSLEHQKKRIAYKAGTDITQQGNTKKNDENTHAGNILILYAGQGNMHMYRDQVVDPEDGHIHEIKSNCGGHYKEEALQEEIKQLFHGRRSPAQVCRGRANIVNFHEAFTFVPMNADEDFAVLLQAEALAWMKAHADDDPAALALRLSEKKDRPYPILLQQLAARQKARFKLPGWYAKKGILFPPPPALEQCSSELCAAYKSKHFGADRVADITGGMGVDAAAFAAKASALLFAEPDAQRLAFAQHNFKALGLSGITLMNSRAEDLGEALSAFQPDLIYLDPSRRDAAQKRKTLLKDLSPDISTLQEALLTVAPQVLVKLGPMLDISAALKELPHTTQVHVLSVQNECRELLFLLEKTKAPVKIICAELNSETESTFSFFPDEEKKAACEYTGAQDYLYDPYAGVCKAGPFRLLQQRFGCGKLHPNTHVYTSKALIEDFPGRIFKLLHLLPYDKEQILSHTGGKATLVMRNFPVKTEELEKKLKLKASAAIWIFLYRDYKEQLKAAVAERIR